MTTHYVLDTNIVTLLLRQDSSVQTQLLRVLSNDTVILGCPVVWHEVRRGLMAKQASRQLQHFDALFSSFVWNDFTLTGPGPQHSGHNADSKVSQSPMQIC